METIDPNKANLARTYNALAHRFNELYSAGKERGQESMAVALEKAHEQLTAAGNFSAEQGEYLKQYLARDLDQTLLDARQLGEEAKERLHPARLGAGALASLASILNMTGDALRSLSDKTRESLAYKSGELTSAGTLACQACGQKVQLKATGHVPPCPKCSATLFSTGY